MCNSIGAINNCPIQTPNLDRLPTANIVRIYDMKNHPLEMIDLAKSKEKHTTFLKKLLKEFQAMQEKMNAPINVSEAFDNFTNNVQPPVIQ